MPVRASASFLFEPANSKPARTARKVHIRRLFDVLELCIHRGDLQRARRAWAVLVRCKEVDWKTMWRTGTLLAGDGVGTASDLSTIAERLEYLRAIMLQHTETREAIFQELVLLLIMSGQHEKALDELELYLPSPPYQDNPVLHLYAGLLCLYLAQLNTGARTLRDAKHYLERARSLDPGNVMAGAWLDKMPTLAAASQNRVTSPESDDEEHDEGVSDNVIHTEQNTRVKRTKT